MWPRNIQNGFAPCDDRLKCCWFSLWLLMTPTASCSEKSFLSGSSGFFRFRYSHVLILRGFKAWTPSASLLPVSGRFDALSFSTEIILSATSRRLPRSCILSALISDFSKLVTRFHHYYRTGPGGTRTGLGPDRVLRKKLMKLKNHFIVKVVFKEKIISKKKKENKNWRLERSFT